VILDATKDNLIPHVSEKKKMKKMFHALVSLYQRENINTNMILQNNIQSIEMTRSYIVTSYLIKIMQICDQLVVVGEKVADAKLVNMTLNGFSMSWESFFKGICAHENFPTFERLWL